MNILSLTTPPQTPRASRPRTASAAEVEPIPEGNSAATGSGYGFDATAPSERLDAQEYGQGAEVAEKTPLISAASGQQDQPPQKGRMWQIPKRMANAILYCGAVVISTITAPGRYVIACFYDEEGHFSAILPLKHFRTLLSRRRRKSLVQGPAVSPAPEVPATDEKSRTRRPAASKRSPSVDSTASTASAATSGAETETEKAEDSPARRTRSKTAAASRHAEGEAPTRKSHRIRLLPNDEALRQRKVARAQQRKRESAAGAANPDDVAAVASALKSPSSPAATATKMTRYPRAPASPRPLVPRRQPSYVLSYTTETPKKTLIIDLDETLIHSMAKGGRMSTGHMVEVRLAGGPVTSPQGPQSLPIGPGVPILYYVHERPGCHEFLRKVAKWYNLVVFTASVQEYADPVVDWLERERKYFSGRYYRQHCTFRNGAYIKDLAQVEPDLSRVMILDNSPMSYIFHEGEFLFGCERSEAIYAD
jgi:CTD nuclear envelope phosphatase 1